MKTLVVCLMTVFFSFNVHAQQIETGAQRFDTGWFGSAGFNAVGNSGTRNPVKNLDEFGFRTPFAIAIENKWTPEFALEQDVSFNGFKKGKELNGETLDKSITYFSTNTSFKWYFTDYLFPTADWLDLYASAGVGIFTIDELNTSGNISGGAIYWFSDYFGVRFQTTAKFAVNAKNKEFADNHFQHFLQGVFRF